MKMYTYMLTKIASNLGPNYLFETTQLTVIAVNGLNLSTFFLSETGRTTTIRRTAVRETGVFWKSCVSNWGHHALKPLEPSQHYCIEGFTMALNWAPIECKFSQSVVLGSISRRPNCNFFNSDQAYSRPRDGRHNWGTSFSARLKSLRDTMGHVMLEGFQEALICPLIWYRGTVCENSKSCPRGTAGYRKWHYGPCSKSLTEFQKFCVTGWKTGASRYHVRVPAI